jgi:hypothetical protein
MRMSSIMRWRNGLITSVDVVMARLYERLPFAKCFA